MRSFNLLPCHHVYLSNVTGSNNKTIHQRIYTTCSHALSLPILFIVVYLILCYSITSHVTPIQCYHTLVSTFVDPCNITCTLVATCMVPGRLECIKTSLAHRVSEYSASCLQNFGNFHFYLSNFERVLGSKKGYAHGTHCPNSWIGMCKASLSTHPSRTS